MGALVPHSSLSLEPLTYGGTKSSMHVLDTPFSTLGLGFFLVRIINIFINSCVIRT